MAAPTLPRLVPTAYSSTTGTAYSTTTVGNIDNGVATPDGAFIVAGANSTATIFYAITDTPADFLGMLTCTYNIRYKIETLTNDTETLSVRIYKSDKSTPLTDPMLVVSTTANISITNKGDTSFTTVVKGTKADWDGAFLGIITTHAAYKGADGSVWSIDEVEINGTYETTATVALSTPTNHATGQSLTPQLIFTGTDPNTSDTLEYEVQIDTQNDFQSQSNIIDQYTYNAGDEYTQTLYLQYQKGQSFKGNGTVLNKITGYFYKATGHGGNVYTVIYAHTGTFGNDGVGTGAVLATSNTIDFSTLPTGDISVDFTFSGANKIILSNNTPYVFLFVTDADGSFYVPPYADETSPTHQGNLVQYNSSTLVWTSDNTKDLYFIVTGDSPPILDKLSDTESPTHFLDYPDAGDTHPFTNATAVAYTPAAGILSNSTQYFWRVRAKDSGSGTWGAWSDIWDFETEAGTTTTTTTATPTSTTTTTSTSTTTTTTTRAPYIPRIIIF